MFKLTCKQCGKELSHNHIRAYAYTASNANFCDKWCYLKYCEGLNPKTLKRRALSGWLQRYGRMAKSGKISIPTRANVESKKIMRQFSFVEVQRK